MYGRRTARAARVRPRNDNGTFCVVDLVLHSKRIRGTRESDASPGSDRSVSSSDICHGFGSVGRRRKTKPNLTIQESPRQPTRIRSSRNGSTSVGPVAASTLPAGETSQATRHTRTRTQRRSTSERRLAEGRVLSGRVGTQTRSTLPGTIFCRDLSDVRELREPAVDRARPDLRDTRNLSARGHDDTGGYDDRA